MATPGAGEPRPSRACRRPAAASRTRGTGDRPNVDTPSRPDNTYRLVLFVAPADPKAVRDLLCKVTGDHPTDAAQWVARAPGIWARPLAEGEVRELLDGLFELGIAAEAWRVDAIPNLIPPRTVHEAACLPQGLRISGLRGEPTHWIPWDKVELIHAAKVLVEDEVRDAGSINWSGRLMDGVRALTHRPGRLPLRSARQERYPRPPVGELHIVRKDPRVAFRFVEGEMNYAYLGDRLRPSASENFPLFLGDVIGHSTAAYVTRSTEQLLANGDPDEYLCDSSPAMLQETTLKLLWSWYRRDREANQPTES